MSEPIDGKKILEELRSMGDTLTTLFIGKLFLLDDRVRTPQELMHLTVGEIEHLFYEGGFDLIFNERPIVEMRVESPELFAFVGKNESAKRMIQLINLRKAAKGE